MKQHAPAADRNKDAILAVLQAALPETGVVLEVASGSGQHAAYFAAGLRDREWLPTDREPDRLASIQAWREASSPATLRAPMHLDVATPGWSARVSAEASGINAIVNINMVHIAPWAAAEGLFEGAGDLLDAGGILFMYGPFMRGGAHTAPSNAEFDRWLRERDPAWGVRDLDDITALAGDCGFVLSEVVEMPANNLSLIFARRG